MITCNVCSKNLKLKVYETSGDASITSVCTTVDCATEVYFCSSCGHVQTLEMPDELFYYDDIYNFLAESEEEDQIYVVDGGITTYRTQHQVLTLLKKLKLENHTRILDYGCAKSSTMRELVRSGTQISPYLFDISENYVPFWREFIEEGRWATYSIPDEWSDHFDVVTSFFSLEHITNLKDALKNIRKLLKSGGYLYAIIPNAQSNPADLIVVDHPNHFTKESLGRLMYDNGLDLIEIDDISHRGAYIIVAKKQSPRHLLVNSMKALESIIIDIGNFWKISRNRISEFESTKAQDRSFAIYGAGFYGSFLASNLKTLNPMKCFLDQNKYLQGKYLMGKKILHPEDIPGDVEIIYVALNPKHSRNIIRGIPSFANKKIEYFYI